MQPDFGATSRDYVLHRAGFPESLFERLAADGVGLEGQSIVDLGTGTGNLARGLARRGCRVIGVDHSAEMLAAARAKDEEAGLSIEYRAARAEATGLPGSAFDVVTAGQCWHWFDRPKAAAESARLLKPDGFLVIAHFDWLPLHGNVVRATEELIEAHNPAWNMGNGLGLYPQWLRDLGEARFGALSSSSYDLDVAYSPIAWRGRIRASAGVGGSMEPTAVAEFDAALAALLAERFPGDELAIPHRVFLVLAQAPRSRPAA
jgi:SAM-dependent methyltransferase